MKKFLLLAILLGVAAMVTTYLYLNRVVPDDAKAAGKTPSDFPQTAARAFDAMDGNMVLTDDEVKGRNTWLFWTAGDQVFWDRVARFGLGTGDLLKTIDSRKRGTRFADMGLINEPGYAMATAPDTYGLWIDSAVKDDEKELDPTVYGHSTGILGLRLFPNPDFNETARKNWDAARYYSDANYASDPGLVRPYRVGMACGFCHVAFDPLRPPANPEEPEWSNLSSTIGNQYMKAAPVFASGVTEQSWIVQVLSSWPRGTIDTSFLATDNINNPSSMNAIYDLPSRIGEAKEERITGGALNLPGSTGTMRVPHVLKDGADSVGLVGALSRVYVSIGTYSQEWVRDHNLFVGGARQRPFQVEKAQQGSVYWQATNDRLPNLAAFLLKMKSPHLQDAPEGKRFMTPDSKLVQRGKGVFANNCAKCHSSKQPELTVAQDPRGYAEWMQNQVMRADFLEDNFLSTDERIPVSVVGTNAARALATNATRDHVWDNFSSETYKTLTSAGTIELTSVIDGSKSTFHLPEGGPGYYRVPSLRGLWATAPFLHNNALGNSIGDPSVSGRMAAFNDAVEKLLWPEKRNGSKSVPVTTADSFIQIPASYIPTDLRGFTQGSTLRLGPIPAGTPVNLIANFNLNLSDGPKGERLELIREIVKRLTNINRQRSTGATAQDQISSLYRDLLKFSNCPDFIEDGGHYFGTALPDDDKRALIEFMKTF